MFYKEGNDIKTAYQEVIKGYKKELAFKEKTIDEKNEIIRQLKGLLKQETGLIVPNHKQY